MREVKPSTKQVIVIRKDLMMRKGKMIAQGCHACLGIFSKRMFLANNNLFNELDFLDKGKIIHDWLENSFTKIVVYVTSEKELIELEDIANEMGILNCLITDNGTTEFSGVPTKTCIAIGPDESDVIDKITGDLPLL